jgi:hypothetical protein
MESKSLQDLYQLLIDLKQGVLRGAEDDFTS